MSNKAAATKKVTAGKPGDNVIRLSLFERPLASGKLQEKFTIYNYLTFRNMVITLGAVLLLIFLGSAVSVRLAFLVALGGGFFGLMLMEVVSRRRWEKDLVSQLRRMSGDYDRLVRDVARNRNDVAELRKKLAEAGGAVMRGYDKASGRSAPDIGGEPAEQRMIRALAGQLSKLSEASGEEPAEEVSAAAETAPEAKAGPEAQGQKLTEDQILKLVSAAVRQDRVDLFLQPIVGLPQRKARFYETFARIRVNPGTYLPAMSYIDIAHKKDLMPIIDNLLLLQGLQIIRMTEEGDYNRAFFFNITSLTLNDPKFMGDLVEFIAQNRTLAPRLVFELGQGDLAGMSADVLPILDGLSKLGCRFSMDRVRTLALDFAHLEARHIRFIKVDASLLMDEVKDDDGLRQVRRLKGECDRQGIDLIVEKIETDRQLLEMLEIDIDYGQGYLFGKPVLYEKR